MGGSARDEVHEELEKIDSSELQELSGDDHVMEEHFSALEVPGDDHVMEEHSSASELQGDDHEERDEDEVGIFTMSIFGAGRVRCCCGRLCGLFVRTFIWIFDFLPTFWNNHCGSGGWGIVDFYGVSVVWSWSGAAVV